jgi:alanine dehydrogenase
MPPTIVLRRTDIAELLTVDDCLRAVESAFRAHVSGQALPPAILGVPAADGGFHVKAAGLLMSRPYFAAKTNANFPGNPARLGLPAIQGVVALFDAANGVLLALMDSMEITGLRTAAATAIAARHLARSDARVLAVFGCGTQGRIHVRTLAGALQLTRVSLYDRDAGRAEGLARELQADLALHIAIAADPAAAAREADICVTCTPSRAAWLRPEHVRPGTFVAAVGADAGDKQELDPRVLARATVVVDHLEQCATIGELHHAVDGGFMTRNDVHAELPAVVAGLRPGRTSDEEITVFDSTGTALQDVAAAVAAYEKAVCLGRGEPIDLGH